MNNDVIREYNEKGELLYSATFPGAFTRAATLTEALAKFPHEIRCYCTWSDDDFRTGEPLLSRVTEEHLTNLQVEDADSDVIFASERNPLSISAYERLKHLALKSAADFTQVCRSIPDPDAILMPHRKTFYGDCPNTAKRIFLHVSKVNNYYFSQLGIEIKEGPELTRGRAEGFEQLEKKKRFLDSDVVEGDGGKLWSIAKLLRRFIWHDRIHARAMVRQGLHHGFLIADPFGFGFGAGSRQSEI